MALLSLAIACGPTREVDRNTIVYAVRTAPNSLNPWAAGDETTARVAQLVFNSLMRNGDDLRVAPELAERLEHPDPLTYRAHLRRGVKFHDGHELTSRDVVYSYTAMLDPAFASWARGAFRQLASVTAEDDHTVVFRLKEPFAAFPTQLVTPPVVPEGSRDSLRVRPVGTGPYRFVSYSVDDEVVLAAFEDYWNGRPANNGVIVKVIPDDTMRGLELRKGSVDIVVNDLPPDIVHQLEESKRLSVVRAPGLDFSYLGFNMTDSVVSDRRVRHAIGYAIDRDAIVTYLRRGLARPAVGLIPPAAWAFEPDVLRFTHDPARAKRLLDEAGYPDPDGGGPLPRLRLSLKISTAEEVRLQGTVIQQDLARVGIQLELLTYEFATLFSDILKGNFQIMSLQWVGGALIDPDILRRVFHSQQAPPAGFNRGHYKNAEVDRLIDLASASVDEAERKSYYGEAQKIIAEDAPYIPIWNRTNAAVTQPDLRGLRLNPTSDVQALRNVSRTATGSASRLLLNTASRDARARFD